MENNRYNNSSIYKMQDQINGYFYIGSTCNPLSKRLSWHKRNANQDKYKNAKVYKYFNEIGWNNVKIVLIEEHYLDNKQQLLREEDRVIQMYLHDEKCLNSYRAFVTQEETRERKTLYHEQYYKQNKDVIHEKWKQWYQQNKDEILECKHIYYEKNKDSIQEKAKQYYEQNKIVVTEKQKQYNEKNKDVIKEKKKHFYEQNKDAILEKLKMKKVTCTCGSEIRKYELPRHERTKKHQAFMHDHQQTSETI